MSDYVRKRMIEDFEYKQSILKHINQLMSKAYEDQFNSLIYGKIDRKMIKCKIVLGKE